MHEMGSVPQTAANTGIDRFLARDRVYDIYFRISSGWLPDITEPLHRDLNAGHRYLNAELGGVWGRAEPPERFGRPYPRVRKLASDAAHPATPCLHDQQVGFYAKKMFIEVELPLPLGKLTKRQEQVSPFFPRGVAPAHRGAGAQRTPLVGFPMLLENAGRRPRSLAVNDDDGRGAATRGVVFMLRRDAPQGRLLTNCLRKSNGGGGETTLEKSLVAFTSEANGPMASCPRVGHVTPKRTCFSRALRSTKTIRRLSVRTSEPARPYARCQDRTLVFVIRITSCYGR